MPPPRRTPGKARARRRRSPSTAAAPAACAPGCQDLRSAARRDDDRRRLQPGSRHGRGDGAQLGGRHPRSSGMTISRTIVGAGRLAELAIGLELGEAVAVARVDLADQQARRRAAQQVDRGERAARLLGRHAEADRRHPRAPARCRA